MEAINLSSYVRALQLLCMYSAYGFEFWSFFKLSILFTEFHFYTLPLQSGFLKWNECCCWKFVNTLKGWLVHRKYACEATPMGAMNLNGKCVNWQVSIQVDGHLSVGRSKVGAGHPQQRAIWWQTMTWSGVKNLLGTASLMQKRVQSYQLHHLHNSPVD